MVEETPVALDSRSVFSRGHALTFSVITPSTPPDMEKYSTWRDAGTGIQVGILFGTIKLS